MSSLKMSARRSAARVRQLVVFRFNRVNPGRSVLTGTFRARGIVNTGEVVVSQRPAAGSTATPVVRYQIVNAATGLPVTNRLTVTGTRVAVLRFVLPPGNFRLRITNAGAGPVAVSGAVR